jgi:hypothetical protein
VALSGTDTPGVADVEDLTARMREFTEARDSGGFHDLKSLTLTDRQSDETRHAPSRGALEEHNAACPWLPST